MCTSSQFLMTKDRGDDNRNTPQCNGTYCLKIRVKSSDALYVIRLILPLSVGAMVKGMRSRSPSAEVQTTQRFRNLRSSMLKDIQRVMRQATRCAQKTYRSAVISRTHGWQTGEEGHHQHYYCSHAEVPKGNALDYFLYLLALNGRFWKPISVLTRTF